MKATFTLGTAVEKAAQTLAFIPVIIWVMYPNIAAAAQLSTQTSGQNALVFEVKASNSSNTDQKTSKNQPSLAYETIVANDIDYQTKQVFKEQLRAYLQSKGSPFAACVDTLVELKNVEKILGLANAESGLGKRYPRHTANAWGVGGSRLWDMGDNLCEGAQSMQIFLDNYPRRSSVKYADMSIDRMNGLYKQPRRDHWARNVNYVMGPVTSMKAESSKIAAARIAANNEVHTAIAEGQLAK
jgi:predicted NBD/HSP70 family sugar kinase